MSTPTTEEIVAAATEKPSKSAAAKQKLSSPWASLFAIVIAVLWTIPTLGLFISSFRPEASVKGSGWWTWFTNPEFTLQQLRRGADAAATPTWRRTSSTRS